MESGASDWSALTALIKSPADVSVQTFWRHSFCRLMASGCVAEVDVADLLNAPASAEVIN